MAKIQYEESFVLTILSVVGIIVGLSIFLHTTISNRNLDQELDKAYDIFDKSALPEDGSISQQEIVEREVENIRGGIHTRKVIGLFFAASGFLLIPAILVTRKK